MRDADLRIETGYRTPPGGQHVGTVTSGVWVTHWPTGLQVRVDTERSQMRNLQVAKSMLEWGLAEINWEDPNE